MDERINYYAVIPGNVRYDSELTPNAKLLYGEITALCNQEGYCWATNDYFAQLYNCGKQAVSRWIAKLKEKGYIDIEIVYKKGSKQIEMRYLKIREYPIVKKDHTYSQNCEYPIVKKANTPIVKIAKENNTSINNTSEYKKERNIKERKLDSYDAILASIVDESLKDLYEEYLKMRKLIKAPMTDRGLTMLIHRVEALEPNNIAGQKALLEEAIVNNWKSVYPRKRDNTQNTASSNVFLDMLKEERG